MKCAPGAIQHLVRWATPESLEAYALMDADDHSNYIEQASVTSFNIVQTSNLEALPINNDDHFSDLEDLAVAFSKALEE